MSCFPPLHPEMGSSKMMQSANNKQSLLPKFDGHYYNRLIPKEDGLEAHSLQCHTPSHAPIVGMELLAS